MTPYVVVIGDVMLDVDVLTRAERLTPDAPAPVLDELSRTERPGGAALAALLAARSGRHRVVLVAPIPDDDAGRRLRALLAGQVELVPLACSGETSVKTRLRARGQTVARLDQGVAPLEVEAPSGTARKVLLGAGAVLVSDYGGGVTSSEPMRALLAEVAATMPVVWDPHPRGGQPVPAVTLVTPNESEAAAASEITGIGHVAARRQGEVLLQKWHARNVAVTIGSRGALLSARNGGSSLFPARAAESGDTCGAGDCFAAAAVMSLAAGDLPSEAVAAAVASATAFVASGAAAGLDLSADDETDLDGMDEAAMTAQQVVDAVRARGGTVVATGGCFDLLHAGHVETLAAARSLGDCLVVCLNSDDSVRRLKGSARPLQPVFDRAAILSALRVVDAVLVFEEDTPAEVLRLIRPDIWVKGGDYAGARLPEADVLADWGGEVVTVPYLRGRSTSELMDLARR